MEKFMQGFPRDFPTGKKHNRFFYCPFCVHLRNQKSNCGSNWPKRSCCSTSTLAIAWHLLLIWRSSFEYEYVLCWTLSGKLTELGNTVFKQMVLGCFMQAAYWVGNNVATCVWAYKLVTQRWAHWQSSIRAVSLYKGIVSAAEGEYDKK